MLIKREMLTLPNARMALHHMGNAIPDDKQIQLHGYGVVLDTVLWHADKLLIRCRNLLQQGNCEEVKTTLVNDLNQLLGKESISVEDRPELD